VPSARLYPEPVNTILKYSFYLLCYLSRLWYYPKPSGDISDIKDWTPERYDQVKRGIADFFDMEHEKFFNDDTFQSLNEMLEEGDKADKYEHLHRIRWKRMNDEVAYNQAKSLGFWIVLYQHLKAE
jgi:hypothetical protein